MCWGEGGANGHEVGNNRKSGSGWAPSKHTDHCNNSVQPLSPGAVWFGELYAVTVTLSLATDTVTTPVCLATDAVTVTLLSLIHI